MKNIQITDNRIEQNIPVSAENVEVSITTSAPQVFKVVAEDGTVSEQTLNIAVQSQPTTLKDEDAEIDALKERISVAQAQLDFAVKALADKQETRNSIATAVTSAVATLKPVEAPMQVAETPVEVPVG